jgi:hypothetical protein
LIKKGVYLRINAFFVAKRRLKLRKVLGKAKKDPRGKARTNASLTDNRTFASSLTEKTKELDFCRSGFSPSIKGDLKFVGKAAKYKHYLDVWTPSH